MNLDTIKDGLERHAIEYADELLKILKSKTINKENSLDVGVFFGENNYRILIDKCPYSGKYRICAFNFKPVGSNIYNIHTDFKVLSGGNVAKMMRYMLEAIVDCVEDAERATAQKTAEAFDPYHRKGVKHYTVSWIRLETSYMAELTDAVFPTKEMAEQFAALLNGAGYKEVKITEE